MAPSVLNLDTIWDVSGQRSAPAALRRGNGPRYTLNRRLDGPQRGSGRFEEEKDLCS